MSIDMINNPPHYGGAGNRFEVIEVIEHYGFNENYHLASALKYIARAYKKDEPKENFGKARWYLRRFVSFATETDGTILPSRFPSGEGEEWARPEEIATGILGPPDNLTLDQVEHRIALESLLECAVYDGETESLWRCIEALDALIGDGPTKRPEVTVQ